jgi:hypothetical protein
MTYIKAQSGSANVGDPATKFTVHYFDENGNLTSRSGGTRTWRCNNPGALLKSTYSLSKKRRAIGSAGDGGYVYAVYPDYETGHEALVLMLRGNIYGPLTLTQASEKYVKEDPGHARKIAQMSKLDPNRTIRSLNDEEFERYWKAFEKNEQWTVGKEDFIEKWHITGVHKKKGVISEYLVKTTKTSQWVSKDDGLKWALEGRLHATIVHLKTGVIFLRPIFGVVGFKILK